MDNNPYDMPLQWMSPRSQETENTREYESTAYYPLTPSYQQEKIRPTASMARRMPKSEALEWVSLLKGYIVVASLLSFGLLGGLIANQIFSTGHADPNQIQTDPSAQGPFMHDHSSSGPSDDSGGFFNQQGGGSGFGQGNSSSPFSGSHAS